MNQKEWRKWLYWFSFAVAVIAVYKIITSVSSIFGIFGSFFDVIAPFLMALLLAYILYMPCKGIEKAFKSAKLKFLNKHSRGFSVFFTYLITLLVIFIIINFVIPNVVTSVKDLVANVPNYYNSTMEYLNNLDEDSILAKANLGEYLGNVNIIEEALKWVDLENINSYIQGIVGATSVIFDIFVTIVVSVYMLLERDDIKSFCANLSNAMFSKKTNEAIAKYFRKTNSIFFSYISGQIIDAVVVGFIIGIALSIMKVKYGILLGFLVGVFNVIPYFGAIFAVALTIIITIFTGGFAKAIGVGIVIIVLQQIDANIINPKILGNSLELSPILVIFAVTVGGSYFGVLGMFLGVPVVAFIKFVIMNFIESKNKKKLEFKI